LRVDDQQFETVNYDLDCLKCIFLCGDGDGWIRKGLTILPNKVKALLKEAEREATTPAPGGSFVVGGRSGLGIILRWLDAIDPALSY